MRIIRNLPSPQDGLLEHEPPSSAEIPFQTRILCIYTLTNFLMLDVPPWGTVLPFFEEMEGRVVYNVEVETLYMPQGTVLGIRWTPHSGNNPHTISHTLPGDGMVESHVAIPYAWLVEAQGEDVLIEVEASYPDGSTESGRSFDVHIAKELGYGKVTIADLQHHKPLNPDKYPDGINVRIEPIANVRDYTTLRFLWQAKGFMGNTGYLLAEWFTSFPCEPGKIYEFVVPPEAYNGLNVPGFDRFEITAQPYVNLAPPPTPQFKYSFGTHIFPVSYDAK